MNISDRVTGRRVVFITHWFPGHPNHGDHLLHDASLALLRASGAADIHEILGNTPWPPDLTGLDDAVLVISGGGNLGGRLYPADGLFGVRIAALLPRNPVIVLPQTYVSPVREADRALLAAALARPNAEVFLRDRVSLDAFRADFGKGALAPDTVMEHLVAPAVDKTADWLSVCRDDAESVLKLPGLDWRAHRYAELVPWVGRYRHVLTDRLHVAILAYRLGGDVWFAANSYHKNAAYHAAWWADSPRVHFLPDQPAVDRVVEASGLRPGAPRAAPAASRTGPWAEARELGDGWVFMPWFGTLLLQPEGWIYHLQHGWLRLSSATAAGLVFWDAAMGTFWWTSPAQYPNLYRFADKSWLWYTPDSRAPRWFRNLQRHDWELH